MLKLISLDNLMVQFFNTGLSRQSFSWGGLFARKIIKDFFASECWQPETAKTANIEYKSQFSNSCFFQKYQLDFSRKVFNLELFKWETLFSGKNGRFCPFRRKRDDAKTAKIAVNLDTSRYLYSFFSIIFGLKSSIRDSIISFLFVENVEKNYWLFLFCRNSDTPKLPKNAHNFDILRRSNLILFNITFSFFAEVSIHSFLKEDNFSKSEQFWANVTKVK